MINLPAWEILLQKHLPIGDWFGTLSSLENKLPVATSQNSNYTLDTYGGCANTVSHGSSLATALLC